MKSALIGSICLLVLNGFIFQINGDCPYLNIDETTLAVNYNSIAAYKQYADEPSIKITLRMPILKSLLLSTFSKNESNIQRLDLRNNNITRVEIDPFGNVGKCLVILDLSHNQIMIIYNDAFSDLKSLNELNLSFNRLKSINHLAFSLGNAIKSVYLNNNQIDASLTNVDTLQNVTLLDLSYNAISQDFGCFQYFPNLIELRLTNNSLPFLKVWAFTNLHKLENLQLGENYLLSLNADTLVKFPNLLVLNISYNLLQYKEEDFEKISRYTPLRRVSELILDGNMEYRNLNGSLLDQMFPRVLNISVNDIPWSCSRLQKFIDVCDRNYIHLIRPEESTVQGKNIRGITCDHVKNWNHTKLETTISDSAPNVVRLNNLMLLIILFYTFLSNKLV